MAEKEGKLEEGFREALDATMEFLKRLKEDTGRSLRVFEKKGQIRALNRERDEKLRKLGEKVYKKINSKELTPTDDLAKMVSEVKDTEKEIKKREKELAELTTKIEKEPSAG
jgi:phosphoglycolate phosphatase-like HAD superfamily hydrolase